MALKRKYVSPFAADRELAVVWRLWMCENRSEMEVMCERAFPSSGVIWRIGLASKIRVFNFRLCLNLVPLRKMSIDFPFSKNGQRKETYLFDLVGSQIKKLQVNTSLEVLNVSDFSICQRDRPLRDQFVRKKGQTRKIRNKKPG